MPISISEFEKGTTATRNAGGNSGMTGAILTLLRSSPNEGFSLQEVADASTVDLGDKTAMKTLMNVLYNLRYDKVDANGEIVMRKDGITAVRVKKIEMRIMAGVKHYKILETSTSVETENDEEELVDDEETDE